MKSFLLLPLLVSLALATRQAPAGPLDVEVRKIDAWASNPDTRLVMVSAMADELKIHRNHLILLRKQTGQNYGQIFVSSLEKSGLAQSAIVSRAAALNREVERRLHQPSADAQAGGSRPFRPVLSVATGADHDSVGTFYWLTPELGIDSKRASLFFGVPYYRNSNSTTAAGVGDAYAIGAAYGRLARTDVEGSLTLGFPTGDKNRGLGAGKMTAEVTGAIAHRFEHVRPFLTAGFANSIFNFAYQRPYIADGNAVHFSGGAEFRPAARLGVGFGGFAVRPFGSQVVYSRIMRAQPGASGAHMPGAGMPGMGGTTPSSSGSGAIVAHMPFLSAQQSAVPASEIADHGANAWMSVVLARGLSLNGGIARSVPFHLTTARVGLSFDVGRLLFR